MNKDHPRYTSPYACSPDVSKLSLLSLPCSLRFCFRTVCSAPCDPSPVSSRYDRLGDSVTREFTALKLPQLACVSPETVLSFLVALSHTVPAARTHELVGLPLPTRRFCSTAGGRRGPREGLDGGGSTRAPGLGRARRSVSPRAPPPLSGLVHLLSPLAASLGWNSLGCVATEPASSRRELPSWRLLAGRIV